MRQLAIFTLAFILASLTGCTGLPSPDAVYALKLNSSNSSSVSVIDNRPAAEKIPRLKDISTMYLGDNNFVPARFNVLKERLSSELPRLSEPVVIHIDSFEFIVYDSTGQVGMLGMALPSPNKIIATELARPWSDRTVICAISGRANGVSFEVNEYKTTSPKNIAEGLDDILTTAVQKIIQRITASAPIK